MSTESLFCWRNFKKEIYWGFLSVFVLLCFILCWQILRRKTNQEHFSFVHSKNPPGPPENQTNRRSKKVASIKNISCHELRFGRISTVPNSKCRETVPKVLLTALVMMLLVGKAGHWETGSTGSLKQQRRRIVNHWEHHILNFSKPRMLKALFETSELSLIFWKMLVPENKSIEPRCSLKRKSDILLA